MIQVRNQARVHLWFEAKFGEPPPPLLRTAEMSRQSYHSSNWGGARTGAGRPRLRVLPPTDIRARDPA